VPYTPRTTSSTCCCSINSPQKVGLADRGVGCNRVVILLSNECFANVGYTLAVSPSLHQPLRQSLGTGETETPDSRANALPQPCCGSPRACHLSALKENLLCVVEQTFGGGLFDERLMIQGEARLALRALHSSGRELLHPHAMIAPHRINRMTLYFPAAAGTVRSRCSQQLAPLLTSPETPCVSVDS
jgi:hypothetical protein